MRRRSLHAEMWDTAFAALMAQSVFFLLWLITMWIDTGIFQGLILFWAMILVAALHTVRSEAYASLQ